MTPAQTALDRAAEAMEAFVEPYFIVRLNNGADGFAVRKKREFLNPKDYLVSFREADCRTWIARQAFAAGLESLISPVSGMTVEAMWEVLDRSEPTDVQLRTMFTAALRAVIEGRV